MIGTSRRTALAALASAALLGAAVLRRSVARAAGANAGMSMGDMSMMGGPGLSADMNTVMALFAHHSTIHRRVEELPNGVRAFTESDDPNVASLLQAHVAHMYGRVDRGNVFAMMSRTLPTLFRNAERYRRRLSSTSRGVSVTETSADPTMVAVIRAHAAEVTAFVNEGMPAMMNGMMGGGMMGGGINGQ